MIKHTRSPPPKQPSMEKPILYNFTSQPPFFVPYNLIHLPCPSALSITPSFSTKDSCIRTCTRNSKFKSPYSQFRLYRNKDSYIHTELKNKSSPRTDLTLVSCQDQEPIKKDQKQGKQSLLRFFLGFEKVGKNLKENLSPKQKGDWKDLMLMSLSFAVYVYISQRIVCAYCAWTSMANHSW